MYRTGPIGMLLLSPCASAADWNLLPSRGDVTARAEIANLETYVMPGGHLAVAAGQLRDLSDLAPGRFCGIRLAGGTHTPVGLEPIPITASPDGRHVTVELAVDELRELVLGPQGKAHAAFFR